MANIILIETSQTACSIALGVDNDLIMTNTATEAMQHAVLLPQLMKQYIEFCHKENLCIDAAAISAGPGSYTGLRIATSTAKGICYALDAKLIAINTLDLIAYQAKKHLEKRPTDAPFHIRPMVDARRMEVYSALYDNSLMQISEPEAVIVNEQTFQDLPVPTYFCGNGSSKCKETIKNPNAFFIDNILPLASDMHQLAIEAFNFNRFEDIAYYEPFYLKEFQATTPKHKII